MHIFDTIKPKSDQLNADDLIFKDRDLHVVNFEMNPKSDQPWWIYYKGEKNPYKPNKTMRVIILKCINAQPKETTEDIVKRIIGLNIVVFRDDDVHFGKFKNIGGIRISHISSISEKIAIKIRTSQSTAKDYIVHPYGEYKQNVKITCVNKCLEKLQDVQTIDSLEKGKKYIEENYSNDKEALAKAHIIYNSKRHELESNNDYKNEQ